MVLINAMNLGVTMNDLICASLIPDNLNAILLPTTVIFNLRQFTLLCVAFLGLQDCGPWSKLF